MKKIILSAAAAALFLPFAGAHAATLTGDWFAQEAGTSTTTLSNESATSITASAPAAASSIDRGAVTYLDSSVSLVDIGDFLQFAGDYSGTVGNNINYALRVGFYNSGGNVVDSDFDTSADSWIGIAGALGNRSSAGATSNTFYQLLNTDKVLDLGDGIPDTAFGSTSTATSTGSRLVTFRIEKTSATQLTVSLISGSVNLSNTLLITTAPTTTFDALAVSWKFGGTNATSSSYDNIKISVIPEPGTLAMVLGGAGLLLLRRRRA